MASTSTTKGITSPDDSVLFPGQMVHAVGRRETEAVFSSLRNKATEVRAQILTLETKISQAQESRNTEVAMLKRRAELRGGDLCRK